VKRIVLTGAEAFVVIVAILPPGSGDAFLNNPSFELVNQLGLQTYGVTHYLLGVFVFSLEVSEHLRIVFLAKPIVVVGPRLAVGHKRSRKHFRGGGPRTALMKGKQGCKKESSSNVTRHMQPATLCSQCPPRLPRRSIGCRDIEIKKR